MALMAGIDILPILQAPHKLRAQLNNGASFEVIWDSGASHTITNDKNDFVGPIQSAGIIKQLTGLAAGLNIKGVGTIAWSFHDQQGTLRTIQLPAYYVPASPVKLLSTAQLLQHYPNERIELSDCAAILSGIPGNLQRTSVTAFVNPRSNIPSCIGYRLTEVEKAAVALTTMTTTVDPSNINLSDAEKEWLRWHQRLGHLDYKKVQFLLRHGTLCLSPSQRGLHTRAAKLRHPPKCAACQFGKQTTRPTKTRPSTAHRVLDHTGILKQDKLFPGQCVSVDHFVCSTTGVSIEGRTINSNTPGYVGGCIMVDNASGLIAVEFQRHLTTHETLAAIQNFERFCLDHGVVPMEFISDSGSAFTSKAFKEHLAECRQIIHFAGTGAHHHNAVAERAIRTVMSVARTMMLHAAIHWPDMADATLWPLAVNYAVHIINRVPNPETGLAPLDVFANQRSPLRRLHDLHVWGCPAYLLDKRIADGKKLPRWESKSQRVEFVGIAPTHMAATPIVLNPRTRTLTTPYHVVFDDWFATVGSNPKDFPDFNTPEWKHMFGDSEYQYVEDNTWMQPAAPQLYPSHLWERQNAVADQLHSQFLPPTEATSLHPPYAPFPPPTLRPPTPLSVPLPPQRENPVVTTPTTNTPVSVQTKQPTQGAQNEPTAPTPPVQTPATTEPAVTITPPVNDPKTVQTPAAQPTAVANEPVMNPPTPAHPRKKKSTQLEILQEGSKWFTGNDDPMTGSRARRSTQSTSAQANTVTESEVFPVALENESDLPEFPVFPLSFKAGKTKNPDIFTLEEALADPDNYTKWVASLNKEITDLEMHGTWEEVPYESAEGQVVPVHWVLRVKRKPDGSIDKYKSRLCVRGDLMHGYDFETHAPTCSWSTIRMVLILALTWGWITCTCDYSNAFIHATLEKPVWIQMPRGYKSKLPGKSCLKLKRSLYGTNFAPRKWFDCLKEALVRYGMRQSSVDPCLFAKPGVMAVMWVDDLILAFEKPEEKTRFLKSMQEYGFTLTMDDSLEAFLGIKFETLPDGAFNLTQPALIDKIIETTGMQDCNSSPTPAAPNQPLGKDPEGEPMQESWSYPSVIGSLLYLSTNTRPDICFAVSQVARFTHDPKQSHATAVKRIIRYLAGTKDKGSVVRPDGNLEINSMSDADFAGLYKTDPPEDKSSAQSRMGYLIRLGNCMLVWKSQLISSVCLATAEAEYYALSHSLRTLLPIRRTLEDLVDMLNVPFKLRSTIRTTAREDNSAALILARDHRLTSRTRYYHAQYHHFWQHVDSGVVKLESIESALMDADYFTKPMPRAGFELNRKRVQGW